jgi:hypothetical protein
VTADEPTAAEPQTTELPAPETPAADPQELQPFGSPSELPVTSLEASPPAAGLPEPVSPSSPRADTPEEAVFREALKLMNDLAGVKAAMAILAEQGQAPAAARGPSRPESGTLIAEESPTKSPEQAPPNGGGTPSGAAGAAGSGTGSAALYALVIALAALAGGLWGRLLEVPVRWRSVTIVALNERPG